MITRASFCSPGFTLTETILSILVIGILAVALSQHLDPTPTARAQTLYSLAERMANDWMLLSASCGTGTDTATSQLPAASTPAVSVLVLGNAAINARYKNCFQAANIAPITSVTASGNAYTFDSLGVNVTGGGTQPFTVTFDQVAPEVAAAVALQFADTPPALPLPASNTSDPRIHWQQSSSSNYQVQILFPGTSQAIGATTPSPWAAPASAAVTASATTPPSSVTLVAMANNPVSPLTGPAVNTPPLSTASPPFGSGSVGVTINTSNPIRSTSTTANASGNNGTCPNGSAGGTSTGSTSTSPNTFGTTTTTTSSSGTPSTNVNSNTSANPTSGTSNSNGTSTTTGSGATGSMVNCNATGANIAGAGSAGTSGGGYASGSTSGPNGSVTNTTSSTSSSTVTPGSAAGSNSSSGLSSSTAGGNGTMSANGGAGGLGSGSASVP